ncbi:MAG: DUF3224 domain-containing protein [Thermoanaerobaculia bacterium]
MRRFLHRIVPACALAAAVLGPSESGRADSAPSPSLVGSWTLVLVDNVQPDGSRVHLYGERPEGLLVLDADGRYSLQIFSADRPRFAAGDKAKGAPEEYRAAVQGSNVHFGRYRIDGSSLIFQIDHASYPNWEGTEQKRPFTLAGDELRYTVPTPTTGAGAAGATGEVVWKRAEARKDSKLTQHAKGEFDVKVLPVAQDAASGLGRMSIDKTFRGDLVGTSVGEMLTAMSPVEGSGAYVAVERVRGTLGGRKGSFALRHTGVMERGKPSLTITVVPDSGTDELAGMAGTLEIEITGGKHFYELEYTLAE